MWIGATSALPALTCFFALTSTAAAGGGWGPWSGKAVFVKAGQSIQSAISSANPGAKIIVTPGTYAEQLLITQSGLTLVGLPGATLVPPKAPTTNICTNLSGNDTQTGICVAGTGVVLAPFVQEHRKVTSVATRVSDVTITGFTVKGFSGENIALVAAEGAKVLWNTLVDGAAYGVLSDGSIDTQISGNTVTQTGPLSFIGICVDNLSGAQVHGNKVDGSYTGLCIQTSGADISGNDVRGTCQGAFVDPGITGAKVYQNHVSASNPICNSDNPLGVYGIIVGGSIATEITGNSVEGISSGGLQDPFAAGIAVVDFPSVTGDVFLAKDNKVTGNVLKNNNHDILLYTNGTGNVVQGNQCATSVPPGLCGV